MKFVLVLLLLLLGIAAIPARAQEASPFAGGSTAAAGELAASAGFLTPIRHQIFAWQRDVNRALNQRLVAIKRGEDAGALWAGILLLVLAYLFVTWPIKAARYACYYPAGSRHGGFGGFLGSVVGMFFLAFGIWSLDRHVPEFHQWLVQLPGLLQQFFETVRGWFTAKS